MPRPGRALPEKIEYSYYSMLPQVIIALPDWAEKFLAGRGVGPATDEGRMRLVLDLARENVRQGTGGPFAAAVFDGTGRFVSAGLNLVTSLNCSVCHAEIVALVLAQKMLGRYDLSNGGQERCQLVAAAEPCAMCLGAIPWSGVGRLVCGARDSDVRTIGFDEGAKPPDWEAALRARGIDVTRDVLRSEARSVLEAYAAAGGPVYSPVLRNRSPQGL